MHRNDGISGTTRIPQKGFKRYRIIVDSSLVFITICDREDHGVTGAMRMLGA